MFPDDFASGCHFKTSPKQSFIDQCVSIRQPLRVGDARAIQILGGGLLVFPHDLVVSGFTSMTRKKGNAWSSRSGPLSNIGMFPFGSGSGPC